jgi:hypothetical protein
MGRGTRKTRTLSLSRLHPQEAFAHLSRSGPGLGAPIGLEVGTDLLSALGLAGVERGDEIRVGVRGGLGGDIRDCCGGRCYGFRGGGGARMRDPPRMRPGVR